VKSRAFTDLLATIKECEAEGVAVLIIDSITHVWRDLTDSYDKKLNRRGRLQFQDWAVIKGEWKDYTDAYVNSKVHIIVCGRAGYEYDYDFNDDGSKDLIKTDIKMKVESEFGFEPSLVIQMERTSENKEEVKVHMGKADRKSKDAKAQHKPVASSKWIHRAYIMKDRTDTINGMVFDYPTFDDFAPHFKALNIGGTHLGVDVSRDSEGLFSPDYGTKRKEMDTRRTIALETIQGALVKCWPGQATEDKKLKQAMIELAFGVLSWKAVEIMPLYDIETRSRFFQTFADRWPTVSSESGATIDTAKKLWGDVSVVIVEDFPENFGGELARVEGAA
jgi:hypothetical protein